MNKLSKSKELSKRFIYYFQRFDHFYRICKDIGLFQYSQIVIFSMVSILYVFAPQHQREGLLENASNRSVLQVRSY